MGLGFMGSGFRVMGFGFRVYGFRVNDMKGNRLRIPIIRQGSNRRKGSGCP